MVAHMDRALGFLTDYSDARIGGGDSFGDRLSCRYTVFLMVAFAVMSLTKHYVGEPIACWCPAHFTSSQTEYTNKVCWTTSTYYLPFEQHKIPKPGEHTNLGAHHISYYQWVGLMLTFQAVLFYVPRQLWMLLNKRSGVAVSTITDAAIEYQKKQESEDRQKIMDYMTNHMSRFLMERLTILKRHGRCKAFFWHLYGKYLITLYLLIKILYLINVILQLYILNDFLNLDYTMYGFEVIRKAVAGEDWTTSDRFPRVTMCDMKIRVLGNIQRYAVQCALPMNLLNEIMFIFLWFWFVFVIIVTVCSFIKWSYVCAFFAPQIKYIETRLVAINTCDLEHRNDKTEHKNIKSFAYKLLRRDGCFLIRLVGEITTDIIAAELTSGLWKYYKNNKQYIDSLYRSASPDRQISAVYRSDSTNKPLSDIPEEDTNGARKPLISSISDKPAV